MRLGETQPRDFVVFGANHPEYKKAAAQVGEIERQLQAAKENIAQRVAVEYRDAVGRESMLEKAVTDTKAEFDRIDRNGDGLIDVEEAEAAGK